jgi:hypothetical protein
MSEVYRKIGVEDLALGKIYRIGKYEFTLEGVHGNYYFHNLGGSSNDIAYEQFGLSREDIFKIVGYESSGDFPVLRTLSDVANVYNYFLSESIRVISKTIELLDGDELTVPLEIESQEHWDSIRSKLKKAGFTWSDGENLCEVFSECHDFPSYIDQTGDLKINILE